MKYNESYDRVIIKYYIKLGIYTWLANERNIKLNLLHLIIFHNISIDLVLTIILILYNGFDKTNLEDLVSEKQSSTYPMIIENVFDMIRPIINDSINFGNFNSYEMNFNHNYELMFI